MKFKSGFGYPLIFLILISTLVRSFLAFTLEFNNDEVYYWTYALYPDWSHFDHPPMVGLVIQLFSGNLYFDSEFFIRLGSVVFGAVNTWLVFLIGRRIKDELTGWYAALLYTASLYCFIIAGVFILPDTPQVFFWLLSLYLLIRLLPDKDLMTKNRHYLLLAGFTIGLAMLSKYTSVFLWVGALAFMLFYNRKWFRTKEFYLSILISFVVFLPVIYWNVHNQFISFTYQSERVGVAKALLRPDFFGTELLGQFFYNNPVNFILIVVTLIAVAKKRLKLETSYIRVLLWMSLPSVILFLTFSWFRSTLPHWTGPAYLSLILLAASYLGSCSSRKNILFPRWIIASLGFLFLVIVLGYGQINHGWFNLDKKHAGDAQRMGSDDISLDLYGWEQMGHKFQKIAESDHFFNLMKSDAVLISYRWFPAANLDYYAARPAGLKMFAVGNLERIHKYHWINQYRGGLKQGMDAYFITTSHDYKDPVLLYKENFDTILPPDTIAIFRGGKKAMNAFVFRMKNLKNLPEYN